MDFKDFLHSYWNVFISHVCQFYQLDKNLIEKYKDELDWSALSASKVMEWNAPL